MGILYPLRLGLLLASLALLAACVERRLLVRTDPPGADVRVNGERVGRSPVTVRFDHYGKALVEAEKPGYHAEERVVDLRSPWYEKPGVDFFSDVLVPARLTDRHEVEIRLEPYRRMTDGEIERGVSDLTRAADQMRRKVEAPR